ncbi:MAG: hypothetical protein RLZZ32_130 [Cyanobacteriota bacterium]|jgi:hypothetical protein
MDHRFGPDEMVVALANAALLLLYLTIGVLVLQSVRIHRRRLQRQARRALLSLSEQPLMAAELGRRPAVIRPEVDYDMAA